MSMLWRFICSLTLSGHARAVLCLLNYSDAAFVSSGAALCLFGHVPLSHVHDSPGRNLFFTTDVDAAIREAQFIFVSVNTPTKKSGMGASMAADLKYVEAATRRIAAVATESKIVIEKSTVPCRTAESMRAILESNSREGLHFDILSNPEFLAEGTAVEDLLKPDRVLIGSLQTAEGLKAQQALAAIYANWVPKDRIITMNLWSSELSKLVSAWACWSARSFFTSTYDEREPCSRPPMPSSPSASRV